MDWERRRPIDRTKYPRDVRARPLTPAAEPGDYVFILDVRGTIHIAPDGSHQHARVLGGGRPACYAGTLRIESAATVAELTNLSGTFRFADAEGLRAVVDLIEAGGLSVAEDALFWFDPEGTAPPRRLRR